MAAVEQRFANAGITGEKKEADMKYQIANMDRFVDEKFATILTPEQLEKWAEASK
jgi:hypothetical protein